MGGLSHELSCSFRTGARKRKSLCIVDEKHLYFGGVRYVENNPAGAEMVKQAAVDGRSTPRAILEERKIFYLACYAIRAASALATAIVGLAVFFKILPPLLLPRGFASAI